MKGDFTRFTHDPKKHYSGVLKQQGRVDVDADWNEYIQIQNYINRTETKDIIGRCGVPNSIPDGFKIERVSGDNTQLEIKPGRIYVQGLLCESDGVLILPNPDKAGIYLAYLDVWQRHITAVEDYALPELALGGVDTTTRIKTEWQVRFTDVSKVVDSGNLDCKPFCCSDNPWAPEEAKSTGMLAAQAKEKDDTTNLCKVEAQGGYRGLENRLYRVEIHTGGKAGTATFKWSRDNGSVVFPIQEIKYQSGKSTITMKQLGKDEVLTLHVGDWVEVLGDDTELACQAGTLAQVASEADGTDLTKGVIVLKADLSEYKDKSHCKIRRWDYKETGETSIANDGAILIAEGDYVPLEKGVEVCFKSGGAYQSGDYWMIPARTRTRDVMWPKEGINPEFQYRHGIEHYYCALALIIYKDGAWGFPHDCRHIFPPLTELKSGGCCISVNEGESIQQAVDSAIAAGGGCICICGGVYRMNGPLVISNACNLNIYGVNAATVLHFEGANKDGDGGILLYGCENITLANMFILADNLPALISTKAGTESRPNLNLTLDNLTLFSNNISKEGKDRSSSNCAVLLGHTRGVSIENCRIVADIGIMSLFGDQLPEANLPGVGSISITHREDRKETSKDAGTGSDYIRSRKDGETGNSSLDQPTDMSAAEPVASLDYGIGVHDLRMSNVSILYGNYGIWALKSVGWHLTDCRINAMQAGGKLRRAAMQYKNSYRPILELIDEAMSGKISTTSGTAIKAFIWKDSTITGCTLSGKIGMNIWAWMGGKASDNSISVTNGLITLWLHEVSLSGNRIECNEGIGLVFAGSYRACIRENHVRGAGRVLENAGLGLWTTNFSEYINEIVKHYGVSESTTASTSSREQEHYPWMALRMLMEEICRGLGLATLRDSMQELLDTFKNFKNIPVLLLASAYLYPRLNKVPDWLKNLPMPVIALRVERNDMEASDAVILLRSFIPMGGMRIGENRIHTLTGQAIQIKANKYTVNLHIIIILWRYLFRYLPAVFQQLERAIAKMNISAEQKTAIGNILTTMSEILTQWGKLSESMLEADYRIENNSIRSMRTAIESNLFELAIQNNHITLEESSVANDEIVGIADMLDQYTTTKNLAVGMRQRSKAKMDASVKSMDIGSDTTTAKESQRDLGEISCRIGTITANTNLKREAQELNKAISVADTAKIKESLGKVVGILQSYVDTCGIWIKGAGCRIVGNQIIVPMDANPQTWAQGGVRFWDDEGTPVWLFAYLQLMLEILMPGREIPSLLSMTETLIDNNEIIRGTHYGIEICGIKNMPGGMGLVDLKIRGNQISDMAGAGIMFHEQSMTIGVDIEDNRIIDCGSITQRDFFADQKGGIVIRNSASCRIRNNRIRCSSSLTNKVGMFAVDLRTIYGLTFTDNHIQHDESSGYQTGSLVAYGTTNYLMYSSVYYSLAGLCGAIRLSEMNGEVGIQDNDILMLRGIGSGLIMGYTDAGLTWGNYLKSEAGKYMYKKSSFKSEVVTAGTTGTTQEPVITNASIQGNHFESLMNQSFFAFVLANMKDLNFSGNNVRVTAPTVAPGTIQNVERGVIAHNMLDTLQISQMNAGVIAGNCSSQAIPIPAGVTAGLNTP